MVSHGMATRSFVSKSVPEVARSSVPRLTDDEVSARTVARLATAAKWLVLAAVLLTVGLFGWFTWVLPRIAESDAAAKTIRVSPFSASPSDSLASAVAEMVTVELPVALRGISGFIVEEDQSTVSVVIGGTPVTETPVPLVRQSTGPPNLVIDGTVERVGDRIRVSLALTNTRRDVVVWTQSWDLDAGRVPVVPADFAQSVAEQIRAALRF